MYPSHSITKQNREKHFSPSLIARSHYSNKVESPRHRRTTKQKLPSHPIQPKKDITLIETPPKYRSPCQPRIQNNVNQPLSCLKFSARFYRLGLRDVVLERVQ